ncbi:hypothetical protein LP420_07280 [Massilia sp. B-10]|nr:hypothetical protein LP420_07280 [Massilia sp. B-10]
MAAASAEARREAEARILAATEARIEMDRKLREVALGAPWPKRDAKHGGPGPGRRRSARRPGSQGTQAGR